MSVDNLTIKEAVARLGSQAAAAAELGLSRDQIFRALRAVREAENPTRLALRRVMDRASGLHADLKIMEARAIAAEDASRTMREVRKTVLKQVRWTAPEIKSGVTGLTPILFTSDFQLGEVIDPDEIDGMNSYSPDIFMERYQKIISSTIKITDRHESSAAFPGIIYLRGGDAISGGIHPELVETDRLSAIPAIRMLMQQEREGIRQLRARFGRVRVISIPGNHGRNTFKSHSKGYANHSYESLLSWWLETLFESDPNVEFVTPISGDAYFTVEGWRFLLSHGDKMGSRGGQGFVGPAATIARGHQKLRQNYASSGKPVDFVLTGHLHTSLRLEHGFANGSVAGYSEYARDLRCTPDAPKQWLLYAHNEIGIAAAYDIQCGPRPNRVAAPENVFK